MAFVNSRCTYLHDLLALLKEAKQDPPAWFEDMCRAARRPIGKGARKEGKFGGQDLRELEKQESEAQAHTSSATGASGGYGQSARGGSGWGATGQEDAW